MPDVCPPQAADIHAVQPDRRAARACGLRSFASVDMSIKFPGASLSLFQIIFFVSLMACPVALVHAAADGAGVSLRPRRPGLTALRCLGVVINGILGTYAFATLPLAQCYAIFFCLPLFITLLAVPVLSERIDLCAGWRFSRD